MNTTIAPGGTRPEASSSFPPGPTRMRRLATASAGPALIAIAVLVSMRGFVFRPLLTNQHPDILSFWLPRYCFLGKSIASGHVPLWNPFLQAGTPYVSDAQSGWLYAPAMLLFSILPCGTAMRSLIALNPLLAGLGLYWFLRKEGLHRAAATAGGLSLALLLGASSIGLSMPFAGSLAWTTVVLAAASGYLSSIRLSRRLMWLAAAAFAWGQVAGAHPSDGLAMGTLIVSLYVITRSIQAIRSGASSALPATLTAVGFLVAVPVLNVAAFLPRLALTSSTSLSSGYGALDAVTRGAAPLDRVLSPVGVWAGWPLSIAGAPGAYAGAAILLMAPMAVRRSAKRSLALTFGLAAALSWALTLDLIVRAGWFRSLVLRLPLGDFYLHNPSRLKLLMLLAVPVLGALGIQSFIDHPLPKADALRFLGAGVGLWLFLPLVLGAHPIRFVLFAIGMLATVPVVLALGRGRRWALAALPAVLAAELMGNAVYGQLYKGGAVTLGLEDPLPWIEQEGSVIPGPLRYPSVDAGQYLTPGRIALAMQGQEGRFLTWAPPAAYFVKGYLFNQQPMDWPGLANGRGMLFGLQDALGYNPLQLDPYWSYIRASDQLPIFYNASVLQLPSIGDLRTLGVRYLVAPEGIAPSVPSRMVAREEGWNVYEVDGWEPRASVVASWSIARDESSALRAVLDPAFDPANLAVVTSDPGLSLSGENADAPLAARATYRERSPEDVRVDVSSSRAAIVVIRNAYEDNWTAAVDGKPARILRADSFLQAVAVPAGRHEIRLVYRDPAVFTGLRLSAIASALLFGAIAAASLLERRRRTQATSRH